MAPVKHRAGNDRPNPPPPPILNQLPALPLPTSFAPATQAVLDRVSAPDLCAANAASPNIVGRVEFQTGKVSDILMRKDTQSEFVMRGVYQIARNDFFFTPDGNFDPANTFGSRFQDVKLSCRLIPPTSSDFDFTIKDYPICLQNLRSIERLVALGKNQETLGAIAEHLGKPQFKLAHSLFEAKPFVTTTDDTASSETEKDVLSEVSEKKNKHIFTTILRKLKVLRPPSGLHESPYKRPRVSASPQKGKGRARN
ncbi:hypothetical protein L210DRAFT_3653056 [Boletus edulis BED1]|uniref:Uncharacterized protein n=1 Tax=Boletus edulis BED1 TaxID=1328754 RepID=A0AAD4G821_BOLED|nr:hypothetical protein L210DRAFT_3653056 [Boletus edulis BED1]